MGRQKYSSEVLKKAIKKAKCWNDVAKNVGAFPDPGISQHLKSRAIREGINFDHFPAKQYRPE